MGAGAKPVKAARCCATMACAMLSVLRMGTVPKRGAEHRCAWLGGILCAHGAGLVCGASGAHRAGKSRRHWPPGFGQGGGGVPPVENGSVWVGPAVGAAVASHRG